MRLQRRVSHRSLQLIFLGLFVPAAAAGQQPTSPDTTGTAAVLLRVRDGDTGHPVVGAQVLAIGTRVNGFTDDSGQVALAVPGGRRALEITSLGYATKHVSVTVAPGASAEMDVRLAISAIPLRGVDVPASRRSAALEREGFYTRQRFSGSGNFLWGDQLAARARKTTSLSGLFTGMKGFGVRPGRAGTGHVLVSTRGVNSMTQSCYPTVYLDGIDTRWDRRAQEAVSQSSYTPSPAAAGAQRPASADFAAPAASTSAGGLDIDLLVPPSNVLAIEAYSGVADTPIEYQKNPCGVVLIWTRRGN